jgi:hypothetical protein
MVGPQDRLGVFYEQSYDAKLNDLRQSFRKIDAAPRCLGSTMFLWGYWSKQKPTYFSAFLSPGGTTKVAERELLITAMVDEFAKYWSGAYPPERAPVLEAISIEGHAADTDLTVTPGQRLRITARASDPDTPSDELTYRWWILDAKGRALGPPVDTQRPQVELAAPPASDAGHFLMAFVIAPDRRASGYTVPFMVRPAAE